MSTDKTILATLALLERADEIEAEATEVVIQEIEVRVRRILAKNGRAKSFTMAMGMATFWDRDGESIDLDAPYPKWAESLMSLIDEFDGRLKVTGCPLRIDGHGEPVKYDW